ncbi:MAG: DUF2971 domain-containing protein [Bacteroidales bacterium]|nr:DUF2971 domain-containing protein [Bacteroidales bacterium]
MNLIEYIEKLPKENIFPGNPLKGKDKYKRLFHYTSFETFVKIWLSKRFLLGPVDNVNDILERNMGVSVTATNQISVMAAYIDLRSRYKQASFTMNFDTFMLGCKSPMMWGLYADKGNGVCIEFDWDRLFLHGEYWYGPVKYKKILSKYVTMDPSVKSTSDVRNFIKEHRRDIFFTKHDCWKGENEFRIVSDKFDSIDIKDAITAIYLTSYKSNECKYVEELVGDNVPIRYIQYLEHNGMAIPFLGDTKRMRLQEEDAAKKGEGAFNMSKAREYYLDNSEDENKSLLVRL